jgi:hypothetical protein
MTDTAIGEFAPLVGTREACGAVGGAHARCYGLHRLPDAVRKIGPSARSPTARSIQAAPDPAAKPYGRAAEGTRPGGAREWAIAVAVPAAPRP